MVISCGLVPWLYYCFGSVGVTTTVSARSHVDHSTSDRSTPRGDSAGQSCGNGRRSPLSRLKASRKVFARAATKLQRNCPAEFLYSHPRERGNIRCRISRAPRAPPGFLLSASNANRVEWLRGRSRKLPRRPLHAEVDTTGCPPGPRACHAAGDSDPSVYCSQCGPRCPDSDTDQTRHRHLPRKRFLRSLLRDLSFCSEQHVRRAFVPRGAGHPGGQRIADRP